MVLFPLLGRTEHVSTTLKEEKNLKTPETKPSKRKASPQNKQVE